jgi:hypothetical protein
LNIGFRDRIKCLGSGRGRRPVATEMYDEGDIEAKILEELTKIRQLL